MKTGATGQGKLKYRYENFGGIISSENPPFLAFVDQEYMKELGLPESELWTSENTSVGMLTAPTEVHFAVTNRCAAQCPHCYMNAGEDDPGCLDTVTMKRALDILAELKVFHVAMGGGEALERPDIFEIAHYARDIGLVPNLTVSGRGINSVIAQKMKVFGQVNLSIDGINNHYSLFRNKQMFEIVDKAVDLLVTAGISCGINCVIGRKNFPGIPELFDYAHRNNLNEIEFLRLKPAGRGSQLYSDNSTTYEQNISLVPMLSKLSDRFEVTAKIDCSFVPMLCYHRPPVKLLDTLATYGCEAGNVLLGIRSNGKISACSFLETTDISIFDLPRELKNPNRFEGVVSWFENAPEPCKSCDYLNICKGGCHGVAGYVTGNYNDPDPHCPFVVEFEKRRI